MSLGAADGPADERPSGHAAGAADADHAAGAADADRADAGAADALRCSAKGCRAAAVIDLHWRNPKLHDAARFKHWLACPEHEEHLADFLARRGFLLGRAALDH